MAESENGPHQHDATCSKSGLHHHVVYGSDDHNSGGESIDTQSNGKGQPEISYKSSDAGLHGHTITIGVSGKGTPHNNMQPFEVVYRWKRTA